MYLPDTSPGIELHNYYRESKSVGIFYRNDHGQCKMWQQYKCCITFVGLAAQRSSVIFHAYVSAHNQVESVGPKYSGLESRMMASSKEGEHRLKFDISG